MSKTKSDSSPCSAHVLGRIARELSDMAAHDSDQAFVKILNQMGVDDFDPLVPTALNEYAASKTLLITRHPIPCW